MNLADFDFYLPPELIAKYPASPRDSSRLLVIPSGAKESSLIATSLSAPRNDEFQEHIFSDLPSLLRDGDLLVFNNSKVIPARLFVEKNGSKIEVFLHKKLADKKWLAFAKPGKKLKVGDSLPVIPAKAGIQLHKSWIPASAGITVLEKLETGEVIVELENEKIIFERGHIPLPPYINRNDEESDKTNYQTVFAAHEGSVAAPTAGLHFTDDLLEKIPNKAFVTLHVGAGTFLPVKDFENHKMHSEWYEISEETEEKIKSAKRVIAVGTTSLRVLESSGGKAGRGETDIFIKPGYKFKVADAMITNFHLPKSTLFMLVSAMAGTEKMQAAYAHAIAHKFRFFSYGDACLIDIPQV